MENVTTIEMIEVACKTYKSNWFDNIKEHNIIKEEVEDEKKEKNEKRMMKSMKTMKMKKMTMNNDVEIFIRTQMCISLS